VLAAGSHPLSLVFTPNDTGAYTTASATVPLTVLKKALTVSANSATRLYGADNPTFSGALSGVVNNDAITASFACAATAASSAGSYPIIPNLSDPNGRLVNYAVSSVNGTLAVNPAPLIIRADDKTKVAGQPNPPLTATYQGFVNGDTAASLVTPVSLTTTATASSAAGTYPIVASGAASPNYTITFVNGTLTVTASTTPVTRSFTNAASISIRDNAPASVYPSTINVSGLPGVIAKVTVKLIGFTHKRPDDLDVLLVGPAGQKMILASDAGGSEDATNFTLTFDDAATASIPDNSKLRTATYRPVNYGSADAFSSPAPSGPYATTLSTFNGTNPNGSWRLFIMDDAGGDTGSLAGGWSVTITTTQTP
jgi:subtilisin-like proprotein convertase family protein